MTTTDTGELAHAVGEELQRQREDRGWSRPALAAWSEGRANARTLITWEKATRSMSLRQLGDASRIYLIRPSQLLARAERRIAWDPDLAVDLAVLAVTQLDALRPAARWAREELSAGGPPFQGLGTVDLARLAGSMSPQHRAPDHPPVHRITGTPMTPTETTHTTPIHQPTDTAKPWWQRPVGTNPDRVNLAFLLDALRTAKNSDNRDVPCVKFAHNNELDAALLLEAQVPDAGFVFRSERSFLDRAAAYLVARQGISSIVVAGAGLPNIAGEHDLHSLIRRSEETNRTREQTIARASVIYVDHDPLVLAHLRTLADENNGVHVVDADPWDPHAMWNTLYNTGKETPGLVSPDHDRVALLLGGVMSFHGGSRAEAAQVVQDHLARLPANAFLAMTHLLQPEHPDLAVQALEFEAALQRRGPGAGTGTGTGSLATKAQIEAMIHGTTLLPPGIVPAFAWFPDGPPTDTPLCGNFTAAVLTQKPGSDRDLPEPPWRSARP
ncbi:SAM-dependent methyltransferase [Amycolatopsis plumensis]